MVGLVIALLRVSPFRLLRFIGAAYVAIVQGIPLLAWLFVFFFGLPIMTRFQVSPWVAATIAFSIYAGAFLGDIWRLGVIDAQNDQPLGFVLGQSLV